MRYIWETNDYKPQVWKQLGKGSTFVSETIPIHLCHLSTHQIAGYHPDAKAH